MADTKRDGDERTPEETERIANAALKRALTTPPKPHKPKKEKREGKRRRDKER